MRIGRCLVAPAAALLFLAAAGPGHGEEGYRFFLDGKPLVPDTIAVAGRPGHLAPGDVISVDDIWLTLGPERDCRFRSAREGVLLELPGGGTRWVGARVERVYGEEAGLVDGLSPLSEADVHGLWGLRVERWTPGVASKARWLDATRVFLTLGQSGSEGYDDLPELPPGLRYLEAMRFVGWRNLARLKDLEFLDVLPEDDFDLRLLAGARRLKVLRLYSGRLKHVEALASLTALESLDLRSHDEVTAIEFVRHLPHLREIELSGTFVRDLAPLSGLTRLETVGAEATPVDRLPDGPLPALRSLDLIPAPVSAEEVASFMRAHPAVRVRHRWNASLRDAVAGATRLRAGSGEECGLDSAAPPPYETTDAAEIEAAKGLLTVDEEENVIRICGCLGGAQIEFFQGDRLLETLNVVCNSMLRWSGWPGDGTLDEAKATALVEWLASRGVPGPRDSIRADRERAEAAERKTQRATQGMSQRLRDALEREDEVAAQYGGQYHSRSFRALLSTEVPLAADRIRLLLRMLGAENGWWSGMDWPEQVADELLRTYSRGELQRICEAALLGDDRLLRRGAARFWGPREDSGDGWPSSGRPGLRSAFLTMLQESRSALHRRRAQSHLRAWWSGLPGPERERRLRAGLLDPNEPVRRTAMLVAGQVEAASAEDLLIGVLGGGQVDPVALPPVPAGEGEDVPDWQSKSAGPEPPISEIAGLALGYLRSRRAQPLISEQAKARGSAMLRVALSLMDERCDLLVADDFRTPDSNQALQLAAVESVVRCGGRHGLGLALGYKRASDWWELEHVAGALKRVILSGDPPGRTVLKGATTLPQLRGWYQRFGKEYQARRAGK